MKKVIKEKNKSNKVGKKDSLKMLTKEPAKSTYPIKHLKVDKKKKK